jgi:hypothetical protein
VELERSLDKFKEQGLGVAAISYDSREILHHFSQRMGDLNYPLLSDEDSAIIRAFGIFNDNVPEDHEWYGMCFPGTYIVDENGIVRSKYFEEMHRQRFTADTLLIKEFNVGGGRRTEVRTDHLTLTAFASQDAIRRGNIISLVLDLDLPPKMHVYAPGVEGYRPISVTVEENPALKIHPTTFPEARMLHLEAIEETVPVYDGKVRIFQDVTISPRYRESEIAISATFSYQACDDRLCYPPTKVPLEFVLEVGCHDGERSPENLRHKGKGQKPR